MPIDSITLRPELDIFMKTANALPELTTGYFANLLRTVSSISLILLSSFSQYTSLLLLEHAQACSCFRDLVFVFPSAWNYLHTISSHSFKCSNVISENTPFFLTIRSKIALFSLLSHHYPPVNFLLHYKYCYPVYLLFIH